MTLLTTSCALIDWVDPIYEKTADVQTPYQIIFDKNGGTGTMNPLTVNSGQTVTLTTNAYSKTDYIFLGWATSSGAVIADYGDGASYTMGNSNVTLYAVWQGTKWFHQYYLKAPNAGGTDQFGHSVSISGDTIVVGANQEDSDQTTITNNISGSSTYGTDVNVNINSGAAYVFVRSGTTWSQQAYLKAPNAGAGDQFGHAVSVSGDTIVVGAPSEDSNQTTITNNISGSSTYGTDVNADSSGAAYVFVRSGTTWSQQAYLKAPNAGASDQFGNSVSIYGDTIVVGAFVEESNQTFITNAPLVNSNNDAIDSGAAYVFVRSNTAWSHQAYLKAPNAGTGDQFGDAVSISGDTIVVGATHEDSNQTTITNNISGSSTYGTDLNAGESGAAYVFVRSGTTWSQQAYLKAPNADANDQFGNAVSISGDTIVVGAKKESSNETFITNGPSASSNDDASDAGAAYVFTRSGTDWSQQAYLKAPNAEGTDEFGYSVSISNDTVVVGAWLEDSGQTTITNDTIVGPDPSLGFPVSQVGAAYVFVRSGTTWSHQAYLKAPNAQTNDQFGRAVSISYNTIVIGAISEDSDQTSTTATPGGTDADQVQNIGAAYVFVR